MRLNDYLKDKMQFLLFQILCMMAAAGFFWACKVKAGQMALFFAAWSLLLVAFLGMDFYRKKRYFDQVFAALERLDQPWLIGELLPDSPRLTDRLHREILRRAGWMRPAPWRGSTGSTESLSRDGSTRRRGLFRPSRWRPRQAGRMAPLRPWLRRP